MMPAKGVLKIRRPIRLSGKFWTVGFRFFLDALDLGHSYFLPTLWSIEMEV